MRFQPHAYQEYAIRFIKSHPVCALILDMGLGKTVSTLTAIKELIGEGMVRRVLVIGPLRVCATTWPEEIGKWEHLKGLTYSKAVGTPREREAALSEDADVYIINRENVTWLVDWHIRTKRKWGYDMVVIDELSSFKSWGSKRYKSLRKVHAFTERWVGLTGTPTPNGLLDLYAEIGVLDGGERLGRTITGYKERWFRPGRYNPQTGVVYSYEPLPGAEEEIYGLISDMSVSMKARDYLRMPDCFYVQTRVGLDEKERETYEKLRKELILTEEGFADIDASNAASLSNKLLQMANGAVYDEDGAVREFHQRKLEALQDLLESANGQSVLVAYWYRHDRERIRAFLLQAAGYKPEEVVDVKEAEAIKAWNGGKVRVGLIHPASAGHGLNLQQGGHVLVWFGLTWSLELYQQTNARLHRQGQEHVVTIHHIVTTGTVDEAVMAALEDKDAGQERMMAAVRAELLQSCTF